MNDEIENVNVSELQNKRAELKVFAADELTFIVQNPNTPKPSKFTDRKSVV